MQNLGLDYFQHRQAWRTGIGLRLRLMERWAQSHELLNLESADRIADILSRLDSDAVSVAFVGEVSRGKSEPINAMFFGSYAHHLLPVGPGRTTLCPTEIKSQGQSSPSLQLLPIQTTADPRPLLAWQDDPQAWTHTGLTTDDTKQLAEDLLRADPSSADIPFIIISSRVGQKHRDIALALGVNHYLGKPYSEEALLALVHTYSPEKSPA